MGICQWQREPSIGNLTFQERSTLLRIDAPLTFFTVIFGTDTFNLKFSRTIQTSSHDRLFSG